MWILNQLRSRRGDSKKCMRDGMGMLLDGIRVLDVSRFIAGPYCGWLLASMGAEVIRVESSRGEFDRYYSLPTKTGENVIFLSLVRGKKSITLNFNKGEKARQLFYKLVRKSDVVIENLGPGIPERWGLTYEDLRRIKPDIILVHITAFGSAGPYKDRVGFDALAQAMSGIMSVTGLPGAPIRCTVPFVDFATATHAALGVVSALLYRRKTGRGQKIELSLLRTAVTWAGPAAICEYTATGRERKPRRIGNRGYWVSFVDLCETRDGKKVMISVLGTLLKRLLRVMGREDLINDARFMTDLEAFENRQVLDPIIKEWIASKSIQELEEIASKHRIPLAPVLDYTEVQKHPQVRLEEMFIEARLSGADFKISVPAFPIRFSEKESFKDLSIIPSLGEHNEEIWGKLCGLSAHELDELRREGVI